MTPKKPSSGAKTAPKRSTTKAAIKKPTAAAKATKAAVEEKAVSTGELSKKELVERMVLESGMKKGDARRALEAVLGVVRSAIIEGKDISAAPLGKIKIARKKQTPNGELAVLRVKLKDLTKAATPATSDGAVAPDES
ncbi:HU family DNA-binding protein [uncultured Litoreibacter sp.]|uniref:HU family DNA-binding protein n=1 Tax=uncultured Litoreibacter sp. TaxID=1392394 RepID=UPI00262A8834|nr:HU family DNA-binding protein [uncultured Litoreibacter sp.]